MNMNEPKLRFKADDGSQFPDWERKCLSDIASFHSGLTYTPDDVVNSENGILVFRSSNIQNGRISYNDNVYVDKELKERNYVKLHDIVVCVRNGSKALVGKNALVTESDLNATWGAFMTVIRAKQNYEFVHQYLNSTFFKKEMYKDSGTATINQITTAMLNDCKLFVPSLPEQQKIADFLSTSDTVIEKQKATVEAWEERKKGAMQKLFNQEVRFKADDGSEFPEWEEKSFSDVFENLNNSTFSRNCLNYEAGNVKYIHYGDILTKFGFAIDVQSSNVPYVNEGLDCEKYASLSDGDIVIADTAEDDTVGKAVEIMNAHCGKTISGLHTIACHPREKFASKYLGYFMNADIYHNQLRPYMQGIKVTSVSKTNIVLTKISVPCLAEQQKIADCLSALDEVIEKQKATLAAWEELKKGQLQQMFV